MEAFTLKNKTVSFCAKRGSGKSCLIKYLVSCEKKLFDKTYVICPTERVNHFYSDIVPENCIFDHWSEAWVGTLIQKMTQLKSEGKNKHVLLILDDLVTDVNFGQSKTLKLLYSRGRHLNISVILSMQYINSIPPIARGNTDYFLVGQQNAYSIDLLVTEYMAGNIAKKEFIEMYHLNTRDYRFFVINCNTVKDNGDLRQIYGSLKTPASYI